MGQRAEVILVLDPDDHGGLELATQLEALGFEAVLGRCPRRAMRMASRSTVGFDHVVFFAGGPAGDPPAWLDALWDAQPRTRCLLVRPTAPAHDGDGFRLRVMHAADLRDPKVAGSIAAAHGRGTPSRSGGTQELFALRSPARSAVPRGFELWESP